MFDIDSFNLYGKLVGVRIDINSTIYKGEIVANLRIKESAKTIKILQKKGARVIILAHQGRIGRDDCISLEQHKSLLSSVLKTPIVFLKSFSQREVVQYFRRLGRGSILMLENLRFCEDELQTTKKNNKILKLIMQLDYLILDAFSVSHRKCASVLGHSSVPLIAGRLMRNELRELEKLRQLKSPKVFLLGGAKPDDLYVLLEKSLKKRQVDVVLLSGIIGEIALIVKGYDLGVKKKWLKEKGYLKTASKFKKLLDRYSSKFVLPCDLAYSLNSKRREFSLGDISKHESNLLKCLVCDVGRETIKKFLEVLSRAKSIYIKGPVGDFEEKSFEYGTKQFFTKIANSSVFSVIGGGESLTAVRKYHLLSKFSYISTGGGALSCYISGERLLGVEALKKSYKLHSEKKHRVLVVGANTKDSVASVSCFLKDISSGDKIKVEEPFEEYFGGGGLNVSVTLSKLGDCVTYLGAVSKVNFLDVSSYMKKYKISLIPTKLKKNQAKSIILTTKDKDRIIFTQRGDNDNLKWEDIPKRKLSPSVLYFTSMAGKSLVTCIKLAKFIKKKFPRTTLVYNPSSYIIKCHSTQVFELSSLCDVFIVNFEEALMLSKSKSLNSMLKNLQKNTPCVIITKGSVGVYLYDGGKVYFQKSFPTKVADSTGAGDCFGATFAHFYVRGYGAEKSLKLGCLNASSLISTKGAENGVLTFRQLLELLDKK